MSKKGKKESPEQVEFREYCREWLSTNTPGAPPIRLPQHPIELTTQAELDYLVPWQRAAWEAGLCGADYPKEYGGGGRTGCQRIANEEMQRAGTPYFPNVIALGMAAPTILFHGSEELKTRYLPKILSCEEIWCQGFSEPDAGSDLASVQTFAERAGDSWVINGSKIWTSLATFASWMIILCRTDRTTKHDGLTYFIVPIQSALDKGVEVRPLIKITGETGFNEVFFTNLEIPDKYRVDDVGSGWPVAMTTLMHERGAGPMTTPSAGGRRSDDAPGSALDLIDLARQTDRNGRPAAEDPLIRDRIIELIIRQKGFGQSIRRTGVKGLLDNPNRIGLQGKLLFTEIAQEVSALALEIEGAAGTLFVSDENAPNKGMWPLTYLNSYGNTIAAGTSEVVRNILGERVLGMPKTK